MSALYIVPTPIGNLEDITLRALHVLKNCDVILAEDTRQTAKLLAAYSIQKKVLPYHMVNEHQKVEEYANLIESSPNYVALVSDAGTPGISDPGYLLIKVCIQKNISVVSIPGPTAFVTALVASGFPTNQFVFEGFLPHKKGRQTRLKLLSLEHRTIILYESPHRIEKLIQEINTYFSPDCQVVIARELTKIYEEYIRGTVQEILSKLKEKKLKGEMVILIHNPA